MFKMYIKLNSTKLAADGLKTKSAELTEIVKKIDSYKIESVTFDADGNAEHILSTVKFGDESYLISILEETPWFMKYVLEWNTDDNGLFSNMIDVEREMGVDCAYA